MKILTGTCYESNTFVNTCEDLNTMSVVNENA